MIGTLICLIVMAGEAALVWYCIGLLARRYGWWHR